MWRQIELPNGLRFEVEMVPKGELYCARAFGPVQGGAALPRLAVAETEGDSYDAAESALRRALDRAYR
jgi:hypothetical protein